MYVENNVISADIIYTEKSKVTSFKARRFVTSVPNLISLLARRLFTPSEDTFKLCLANYSVTFVSKS